MAEEMEKEYPDVTTDYMYVDNAAMRMIQDPKFFDVMVTENTFGDILTDEGSCITGSMGLLPSGQSIHTALQQTVSEQEDLRYSVPFPVAMNHVSVQIQALKNL